LSASYVINADDYSNAIIKASKLLADDIYERGLSVTTVQQLFGASAEEIKEGGERLMSRVVPANIFFERTDGDMVYIDYYPPLERSKRIPMTREEWGKTIIKKVGEE